MKKYNYKDYLAEYVFYSKYSQKKDNGLLETWEETVDRIYAMHKIKLIKENLWNESTEELLNRAKEAEYKKLILTSQRGRQFASIKETDGILKHEAKLYNCSSTLIDRPEVFSEIMYLLLCGCGVGYSLHKGHIEKLPSVKHMTFTKHHNIDDSIEGWADAIKALMEGAFQGYSVEFGYDMIRPKGSLINGKFQAPGSESLRTSINNVKKILSKAVGRKLTSLELHDILCFIAEAVVSGGVRRSALIALFDKNDKEMLSCKTGTWYEDNKQRAMANNSMLNSSEDKLTHKEIKNALQVVRQFGEPGIINVPNYDYTLNPCAEIVMNPVVYTGDTRRTGFAFCNLVEINGELMTTPELFHDCCLLASFMATVQALYVDFKYLSSASRDIAIRDRAIGVSITGLMSNKNLVDNNLTLGAEIVVGINQITAKEFNINPSKRSTTVKPSGNASAILGLHCSGIHPAHDLKYLRRVRITTNSPEYTQLKDTPLVKLLTADTAVISFPMESGNLDLITKDELSAVDHLKYIGMVKHYWVNKGVLPGEIPNNVSATVEVRNYEWDEVAACLYLNDHLYTGVSLLPSFGDQIYDNAPFQRLSTPEVEKEYNDIVEYLNTNEIDFNAIMSNREDIESSSMAAMGCSGGACEIL